MKSGYPRTANCKICGGEYKRRNMGHVVCCPMPCGVEYHRQKERKKQEKAERADTKRRKEALKSLSEWLKEAQEWCNRYIRLRDHGQPCISCGTVKSSKWDAGHYRTVAAAPELRFHPMNIHKQCGWNCNTNKSGNVVEYRIELVKRIGKKNVEWLEGPHELQHLRIEDAKEIKVYFQEQCKILKKEIASGVDG